jgi:hypothetical protein
MQQLSHQTLNSASGLFVFAAFIVAPVFIGLARLLLKARDRRAGVIRLMPVVRQNVIGSQPLDSSYR